MGIALGESARWMIQKQPSNVDGIDIPKEECAFLKLLHKQEVPTEGIEEATMYTDGSCRPNPGPGSFGIWGTDSSGKTYNMWGYVGDIVTNNRSELFAYIRLLEAALHFKWKTLHGYFDSRYVMDGAKFGLKNWAKNGWKTRTGDNISNLHEWKRIDALQDELKRCGQKITYTWVKGHSGDTGNDNADANADRGRLAGESGDKLPRIVIEDTQKLKEEKEALAVLKANEGKETKLSKKAIACSKLIAGKKLVFCTNTNTITDDGYSIYFTNSFEDKVEDAGKYIGKISSDSLYGVVLTKNPITQIDSIIKYQNNITPDDFQQPVLGLLPRIQRPDTWSMLTTYGNTHLTNKRLSVQTVEGEPLTLYMRPPRNGYDALDILSVLLYRLDMFRFNTSSANVEYVDITNFFYDKPKTKWVMSSSYDKQDKAFNVDIKHGDASITVPLTIGVDIPPRNNITGLLKQVNDVSVHLVKYDISDLGFRYCIIFKADDDYGIYCTPMANIKTIATMGK